MAEIERVGNALCLDFANTVNVRPVPTRDWLGSGPELASWAGAAGHPLTGSAASLQATLPRARELRETVYRVFSRLAAGRDPSRPDLDALGTAYAAAVRYGRLARSGESYSLSWPGRRTGGVLLWEVAASAVGLLTGGRLDRLGQCPSCGWLFLDTSRNRRRRWCSMATCGARDKARRYYAAHATG
jgi:predicted RNA-binding Zn ribbon-like protein